MEDCEIVVGNRSLNSSGDARGNFQEDLERIVVLSKRERSFRTETMGYRREFMTKEIATRGNVFLCGTAFKTVGASWRVTARIAFKDPVNDGTPD